MKISICHVSSVHPRHDVRVFQKQCVSLVAAGYKVRFLLADGKGNSRKQGVLIRDVGRAKNRFSRMLFSPLKLFLLIMQEKAAVFHFHDPELLPLALLTKLFKTSKVIYDAHESYSDMFLHKEYLNPLVSRLISIMFRRFERFVIGRLDQVVSATEHIARQLEGSTPVTTIFNYPSLSEWDDVVLHPDSFCSRDICYIGGISEERGLRFLIEAIEPLDCTLHLAGSYDPPAYRDTLAALPGWKNVIEYGYVTRVQAKSIISQCLAGAILLQNLPNHVHALSTKTFEYMAGGIAVLASDFDTVKQIIAVQDAGICVDPADVSQIRAAIQKWLDDPSLAIRMGRNGRAIIDNGMNWESQIPVLLKMYADLLTS